MLNHGLINYNPKFFWMLARSNGYKWLYFDYQGTASNYAIPQNIVDDAAQSNPNAVERLLYVRSSDAGLIVAVQKVFETAFVAPLDVDTGATTENKAVAARYWTVFTPNAFSEPDANGKAIPRLTGCPWLSWPGRGIKSLADPNRLLWPTDRRLRAP
jgi:hypothetical protein